MAMPKFSVTYEIVTHESAAHGDVAERGFVSAGGWHHPHNATPSNDHMRLREAISLVGRVYNAGRWFVECDERPNYETGGAELRALHPPRNITEASYRRLTRLLRC